MKTLLTLAFLSSLSLFTIAHASAVPQLECFGTEPFWGVTTDAKGFLSMTDPVSETKKFYSKTTLINAHGTSGDFAFQIEAQDMLKNILKLNVVKEDCNDGMSDITYPYTALVDVDGGLYFGCCR